ncbi:unnamed protein product [Cunninghamella blakesleeana]
MIDLDMFERNQIDELRRETALMALSKHENILPVYSSFVSGSKLAIITPYLSGGSCLDIMKTAYPDGFDEISIATILKQALDGLVYLHKNGHIHRDIKAGNLLMDQDGTVLLGDFGVSSSLMETDGKGVRKTFVGTPCWMAPEVMEQAGYDYKADIWSFGITAIELATGQAPFAKLPPLKVLLMTLSHDPPTLIRENTKHKYSKTFKDMIDLTLNKDPTCRPSAEKLLLHPFFKQAKRKDYLVKNILYGLPELEVRPRKTIQRKQLSFTTIDEWDFNDDEDIKINNDDHYQAHHKIKEDETNNTRRKINDNNNINNNITYQHIENINHHQQQQHQYEENTNLSKEPSKPFPPRHRRHISFGNVVVRNPPYPTESTPSPLPTLSTNENNNINKTKNQLQQQPSRRKNLHRATASLSTLEVKKSSDVLNLSPSLSSSKPNHATSLEDEGANENKSFKDLSDSIISTQSIDELYHPLTKTCSNDSTGEKKSRFEIQHGQISSSTSTSGTSTPIHYNNNNNNHRSIISVISPNLTARDSSTHPNNVNHQHHHRVTSKSSNSLTHSPHHHHQQSNSIGSDKELSESKRKVGRFELTTTTPGSVNNDWSDTALSSARNSFDHTSSSLNHSSTFSVGSNHPNHPNHHHQHSHSFSYSQNLLHPHQQYQLPDSHYSTLSATSSSPFTSISGGGLSPSKYTTSIHSNTSTNHHHNNNHSNHHHNNSIYSNSENLTNSILKSYMEDLVINMEAQKHLIQDIYSSLHVINKDHQQLSYHRHRSNNTSSATSKSIISNDDSSNHTLIIESLEKQLDQLGKENMTLRKENENLRKELADIHMNSKEMI